MQSKFRQLASLGDEDRGTVFMNREKKLRGWLAIDVG
jgi:hypothetical protein